MKVQNQIHKGPLFDHIKIIPMQLQFSKPTDKKRILLLSSHLRLKVKAKAVSPHAMVALGGKGGIVPLILGLDTRSGSVVSVTPRLRFI
jgi:hypothetical protein